MIDLEHIPDHVSRGLDLLPLHWRTQDVPRAVLEAALGGVQSLETDRFDSYMGRFVDLAKDHDLRWLARVTGVGEQGGLSQAELRRLVRLAIRAQDAGDTVEDVLTLWSIATDPDYIEYHRYTRKGGVVVAWRGTWMSEEYAVRAAKIVRDSAGTGTLDLFEALTTFHGAAERTGIPVPAYPPTSALGAKEW